MSLDRSRQRPAQFGFRAQPMGHVATCRPAFRLPKLVGQFGNFSVTMFLRHDVLFHFAADALCAQAHHLPSRLLLSRLDPEHLIIDSQVGLGRTLPTEILAHCVRLHLAPGQRQAEQRDRSA